ncbi:MAG: excisionase [Oscillospiraceae bacterium]|nr:excisionase [Oscillospiraceae bacterium]
MNYVLSHREHPVLDIKIDEVTGAIIELGELYAPARLPIGVSIKNGKVDRAILNNWWLDRSIPSTRFGLREALQTLQLSNAQLLLTKCYGLSLSDQYWIYPKKLTLRWEDINFFDNTFSEDIGKILFGEVSNKGEICFVSPDNTSDGWLKKKWIISDGKRQLIKGGSNPAQQEPYNEVLASAVMRRLGIPHISYKLTMINELPYSICDDFITRDTELVPAWRITQIQKKKGNTSQYQHYLSCCEYLGILDISNSLDQMLTVDYIIVNEDRHFNNFGVIRNANTLEWIGAAPIFDSGTSVWYNKFTHMISHMAKHPSKPFRSKHSEQIKLVKSFKWLDIEALSGIDEEFREIISGSIFIDEARCDRLCIGIRNRVKQLEQYVRSTVN